MLRKNEAKWIESRRRWQINVQNEGVRRTFTSTTAGVKGKIQAEKKADAWLAGQALDSSVRFDKLYRRYLEQIELLGSHSNYVQKEQIGRIWLLPYLGRKKIGRITGQSWQDCINAAYKAGRSKKTLCNIRGAMTDFFRFVRRQGIALCPPDELIIPKNAAVGERHILQPRSIKTLFTQADTLYRRCRQPDFYIYAYRFLVLTGLRRGELCGLKAADIQEPLICVCRSVNRFGELTEGKTKNARRQFVLSQAAVKVWREQQAHLRRHGIVSPWAFPDPDGDRLDSNTLYNRWDDYRTLHGLSCSLHELRHTFISLAQADAPETLLKRAVGHSGSMDTFGVYGHTVDGEMQRLANILDHTFAQIL